MPLRRSGGDNPAAHAWGTDSRLGPSWPAWEVTVPEPKLAKSRLHLDLSTATPEQLPSELVASGASVMGSPLPDIGRWEWQVMLGPERNEFCSCREED
ncbi:MAG: VOC family protein [Candidatus Dormibacteria bacterium]